MKCVCYTDPITIEISLEHWTLYVDTYPACPLVDCECGLLSQHASEVRFRYYDLTLDPDRFSKSRRSCTVWMEPPEDGVIRFSDIHDLVDQAEEYAHANPERFPGMFPADYWG